MKTENKILLDKIIKNKCAELGFERMEIQKEGPGTIVILWGIKIVHVFAGIL